MTTTTVDTISNWLALLTLIGAIAGSIVIVGTAVYQSLKARTVRWDVLGFIFLLLWALPYGIRNYGPELMDASIDLINNMATKRDPLEGAIRNLIGDTGTIDDTQVILDQPTPTGGFPTAVPISPTPNQFEATATVFFQDYPTPQPTAYPTAVPLPTVFICRTATDVMAGCQPPTPEPNR